MTVDNILHKGNIGADDILRLLSCEGEDDFLLRQKALDYKNKESGRTVYLRGIVKFSNICAKNCFYCGIGKDSKKHKYIIDDREIISTAKFIHEKGYASIILEAGERQDTKFIDKVDRLIREIKDFSMTDVGITLMCGEQKPGTYERWYKSGAHRYILRIETTNEFLYQSLHPQDYDHDFDNRKRCLNSLKNIGYQVGSGILTGLPGQTIEDIAYDIEFMREFDIDIFDIDAYLSFHGASLSANDDVYWSNEKKIAVILKTIAIMRILMKDINITVPNTLNLLATNGCARALSTGANILHLDLTPPEYYKHFSVYEGFENINKNKDFTLLPESIISQTDATIGYGTWGDSKHYFRRMKR